MLAPMTPHLSEELWEMLGHADGLWKASWRRTWRFCSRRRGRDPVQVNAKCGALEIAAGAKEDAVVEIAQKDSSSPASHGNASSNEFTYGQLLKSRCSLNNMTTEPAMTTGAKLQENT